MKRVAPEPLSTGNVRIFDSFISQTKDALHDRDTETPLIECTCVVDLTFIKNIKLKYKFKKRLVENIFLPQI